MAIIVPGLFVAVLGCLYIILRGSINPGLAPAYDVKRVPIKKKLADTARYILPLFLIFFCVIGVVLLGIATPSEAAACGTCGAFILAACYGKLNFKVVKAAITDTIKNSAMILIIIAMSTTFSQILATPALRRFDKHGHQPALPPLAIVGGMMLAWLSWAVHVPDLDHAHMPSRIHPGCAHAGI
jgi:TRAP-type mannitol/chloroaromatic compound transport system permease large subunit